MLKYSGWICIVLFMPLGLLAHVGIADTPLGSEGEFLMKIEK